MNIKGIGQSSSKKTLRFRRWSRKASAVFHSLHASVGIGKLSVSVIRSLEKKTSKISSLFRHISLKIEKGKDEASSEIDLLAWLMGELCPFFYAIQVIKIETSAKQKSNFAWISNTIKIKSKMLSPQIEP